MNNELVLLPSLKAHIGPNNGLVLTQKFLNGVAQYAKTWPGPVTALVEIRATPTSDMDHVEVMADPGRAPLELRPGTEAALRERLCNAAAVLGFLAPENLGTSRLCYDMGVPLIPTSEYSPATERQIIDANTRNPLLRWRRKLWVHQAEKKRLESLRLVPGLQCSGTPAYEHYRPYCPDTLLFFDNRVPVSQVIDSAALEQKLAALTERRPLRLVFGGRLIAMKGVLELPRIAAALRDLGVAFQLDIYGKGDLESALQEEIRRLRLEGLVALRGALDFETGWIPMLKRETDLFLCCHPQGDPSCTYPEVMSCGVPIVGYANEAFAGIVRESGSGWMSPMNNPVAIAHVIARLDRDREALCAAARTARTFAAQHAFEATFEARTRHLIRLSRLPQDLKQ
jgi:colanic acid/amylovoran biosynthesis glycosyltransferase